MEKKYRANIVMNKEKLSDGEDVFVVQCTNLGIASQGKTSEEAIEMIKEAIELYLEEKPEAYEDLEVSQSPPVFSFVEIKKPIQNT